jgi:hypothetical protein
LLPSCRPVRRTDAQRRQPYGAFSWPGQEPVRSPDTSTAPFATCHRCSDCSRSASEPFAQLALTLPENTDPAYIRATLIGVGEITRSFPSGLVFEVIRTAARLEDRTWTVDRLLGRPVAGARRVLRSLKTSGQVLRAMRATLRRFWSRLRRRARPRDPRSRPCPDRRDAPSRDERRGGGGVTPPVG